MTVAGLLMIGAGRTHYLNQFSYWSDNRRAEQASLGEKNINIELLTT